ncbi:hypothetical protein [Longimicrobium sp.]|uniref:hypothetical protein n=1 Tax=Longimicrobium sp. TaxID=2029185 RepID=UPI002E33358C|nr:hypothetical protein [Longimicrobium sp.]HEX6040711.1 hypothetical protein [Longimicrobium sp.]
MRKLTMKLEELEVETFATAAPEGERGTVLGRETSVEECGSGGETCGSCDPYASDCFYTCGRSCWGSCWSCDEYHC